MSRDNNTIGSIEELKIEARKEAEEVVQRLDGATLLTAADTRELERCETEAEIREWYDTTRDPKLYSQWGVVTNDGYSDLTV